MRADPGEALLCVSTIIRIGITLLVAEADEFLATTAQMATERFWEAFPDGEPALV